MKTPMVMKVESMLPSGIHTHIKCESDSRKKKPQIKASLDKNKSQRIGILV
jgi:hypothetical protein